MDPVSRIFAYLGVFRETTPMFSGDNSSDADVTHAVLFRIKPSSTPPQPLLSPPPG